jgi:thiol-disulfide isomerase/thioredoxin
MKKLMLVVFAVFICFSGFSQKVNEFKLQDVVSGRIVSLSDFRSATAVVLIFTNNTCPFSKLYEERIVDLANQFGNQNFDFVLVNPHSGTMEGEHIAEMVSKSQNSLSNLPYLLDSSQELVQSFGISKMPEAVVITNSPTGFAVAYQGAIDNNAQLPQSVTKKYLEDALASISAKKTPSPSSTRSVGCNIKISH